jgi:hypothetical protein
MTVVDSTVPADGKAHTILVEVDELPDEATDAYDSVEARGEALDRAVAVARDVYGEGLDLVRSCAARVARMIVDIDNAIDIDKVARPSQLEVQLAIKLDGELGAIIAKSSAGAQLQVTMTWARPTPP